MQWPSACVISAPHYLSSLVHIPIHLWQVIHICNVPCFHRLVCGLRTLPRRCLMTSNCSRQLTFSTINPRLAPLPVTVYPSPLTASIAPTCSASLARRTTSFTFRTVAAKLKELSYRH